MDDGEGMTEAARKAALKNDEAPSSGLKITNQQLFLLYGDRERLRLYRRKSGGTLAAFAVPLRGVLPAKARTNSKEAFTQEKTDRADSAYRG